MAMAHDDPELHWFEPSMRGIIPLNGFHISRSLKRRILRAEYEISIDRDFDGVLRGCAARPETWINEPLRALYHGLFDMGHAHSLEVLERGRLIGGVFAVTLGRAFFGESMFSRQTDASKIALAYTVDRLRVAGFTLFDTQYLTPHLQSLGGIEIPKAAYRKRLAEALDGRADFSLPSIPDPQLLVQRMTQTS